jgi:hypothetical protein
LARRATRDESHVPGRNTEFGQHVDGVDVSDVPVPDPNLRVVSPIRFDSEIIVLDSCEDLKTRVL